MWIFACSVILCVSSVTDLHRFQIFVKILLAGDLFILLNIRIALDDVQVDLREEALRGFQNMIGLLDEMIPAGFFLRVFL